MALMRELQEALYIIARQAELASGSSLLSVQRQAEESLRLIDSFLMSAQAEIGQTKLNFAPYGVGSIMHESAYELRSSAGCNVRVQTGFNQPIMTHGVLLKNLLSIAGNFIADIVHEEIVFRSFLTNEGDIGVGVFAQNFDLTQTDLREALSSSNQARMPMARHSQKSAVMLFLADGIAQSLGSTLKVKRLGSYRGLSTMLQRSEQLSLVN